MAAALLVSPTDKKTPTGHDPFSQTITPVPTASPRAGAIVVSLPRPVVPASEQGTSKGPAETDGQSVDKTAHKVNKTQTDQDKPRKISYKIPRLARRHQSRSEPSTKC